MGVSSGEKHLVYKGNRNGIILIATAVIILFMALVLRCRDLISKNDVYAQQIESLKAQITEENGRTEKIEEYRDYTSTDAYIERAAREKLGLVYPDEIIFVPSE